VSTLNSIDSQLLCQYTKNDRFGPLGMGPQSWPTFRVGYAAIIVPITSSPFSRQSSMLPLSCNNDMIVRVVPKYKLNLQLDDDRDVRK
jgi:hypothetical protein